MRFWFYMTRALWRVIRGRWYVWRDVPTDVVRMAGGLWLVTRNGKDVPDNVQSAVLQARTEYKLRKRKEALNGNK